MEQAGTLTLIGAPGLGKTMLAICVATKQIQLGYTARFITAQASQPRTQGPRGAVDKSSLPPGSIGDTVLTTPVPYHIIAYSLTPSLLTTSVTHPISAATLTLAAAQHRSPVLTSPATRDVAVAPTGEDCPRVPSSA